MLEAAFVNDVVCDTFVVIMKINGVAKHHMRMHACLPVHVCRYVYARVCVWYFELYDICNSQ